MVKQCCSCKELKPIFDFNKKRSNKDGLERYCKVCHRLKNQKHYNENKSKYKQSAAQCKSTKRDWYIELKQSLTCEICGESRWWCLDFHHTDPSSKETEIFDMINRNLSKKRILNEITKCVVVCKNCHADIHYKERINRSLV